MATQNFLWEFKCCSVLRRGGGGLCGGLRTPMRAFPIMWTTRQNTHCTATAKQPRLPLFKDPNSFFGFPWTAHTKSRIWPCSFFYSSPSVHSMARANLKKVNGWWWQIPPQHQSTYLRSPESASIEIPPFRLYFIKFSKTVFYEVNLVSQCLHLEVLLLSKSGSERRDLN